MSSFGQSEWLWQSGQAGRAVTPGWVLALTEMPPVLHLMFAEKSAIMQNISVLAKQHHPWKSCSDGKILTVLSKFISVFSVFHGDSISFSH